MFPADLYNVAASNVASVSATKSTLQSLWLDSSPGKGKCRYRGVRQHISLQKLASEG